MTASLRLWRDRRGRVSRLRIAALLLLAAPLGLAAAATLTPAFWARPLNDLIHRSGWWALILLLISLAITPVRRIARFGQLVDVRRMIGVGAFAYAALHLTLYMTDQRFDLLKVASEIVHRLYLAIGFTTFLGLAVLAATSTDAMMRRLGGLRWRRLHRIVYALALLALVHFFQQTKADVSVPVLVAGLFAWLMAYRLLAAWWGAGEPSPLALAGFAVAVGALVLVGEAVGLGLAYRVSPLLVLGAAFDVEAGIRPGWIVLAAGLGVVALDLVRARQRPSRKAPPGAEPALAPVRVKS